MINERDKAGRFKKGIVPGNLFKKGHVPANKGIKLEKDGELYNKMRHTFFQKGNKPHNTKFDGHERLNVEGYVEVRIAERKYVFKHRLLWETEK